MSNKMLRKSKSMLVLKKGYTIGSQYNSVRCHVFCLLLHLCLQMRPLGSRSRGTSRIQEQHPVCAYKRTTVYYPIAIKAVDIDHESSKYIHTRTHSKPGRNHRVQQSQSPCTIVLIHSSHASKLFCRALFSHNEEVSA